MSQIILIKSNNTLRTLGYIYSYTLCISNYILSLTRVTILYFFMISRCLLYKGNFIGERCQKIS